MGTLAKIAAGLLLAALGACGSTDPDRYSLKPGALAQLRVQPIALDNFYKVPVKAASGRDLMEATETARAMLRRAMEKQGMVIAPQAAKTVTLRVLDVRIFQQGGQIGGTVMLDAHYGSGAETRVMATNTSPVNAGRAVDGATLFALNELVAHRDFVDYINR